LISAWLLLPAMLAEAERAPDFPLAFIKFGLSGHA
jgi:hypothetical protein